MIIKSEIKGRNRNFVDKLHARSRGIREGSWARWFFRRMDNGIRWGKDRRSDRRRSRAFFDNKERGETGSINGCVRERGDKGNWFGGGKGE